jgi:hypothetical protein
MRRIDELHLEFPFAGSRMLRGLLAAEGSKIGRRHIATLMRHMGIEAIYRRPVLLGDADHVWGNEAAELAYGVEDAQARGDGIAAQKRSGNIVNNGQTAEQADESSAEGEQFDEVRGRLPYWDGGYLGNPAIFPLFRDTRTEDVLIVQLNPIERREVPTSAHDIMNRANEISFNASLFAEYRAMEFVARLIDQGRLARGTGHGQYRRVNAHRITLGGHKTYTADTKLETDYDFFRALHAAGRGAARRFLDAHFNDIGVRSTFDLRAEALAEWA